MRDEKEKKEDESSHVLKEFLKKKPDEGEDLLSLVLETGRIPRSAASRSLRVPENVIDVWCLKLEKDGWLNHIDRDLGDYMIELSDAALKKLRNLERDFFDKVEEEASREEKTKQEVKTRDARKTAPPHKTLTLVDALVFLSVILSAVMFKRFSEDTTQTMLLLFGILLIVFSVIIYQRKAQHSKARSIIVKLWNAILSILLAFKVHKRHVLAFALFVGVMYLVGRFLIVRKLIYLVEAVICFSFIPFAYTRRGNKRILGRMYLGIILTIYALLIIFGFTGFTEYFTAKVRVFDILAGITLLLYLKIKESYFRLDALAKLVRKKEKGEKSL
ncbi:MAG: hypothetical protein ABH834_03615 [Candidatus Altiarchaeota archaeon]